MFNDNENHPYNCSLLLSIEMKMVSKFSKAMKIILKTVY